MDTGVFYQGANQLEHEARKNFYCGAKND